MDPLDEVVLAIQEACNVSILSYRYTCTTRDYLQCICSPSSLVYRAAARSQISSTFVTYDVFLSKSHTVRPNAYRYSYLIGNFLPAPFIWPESMCRNRHSAQLIDPTGYAIDV